MKKHLPYFLIALIMCITATTYAQNEAPGTASPSGIDSLRHKANVLNQKIDSARKALEIHGKHKAALLAMYGHQGASRYATSNKDLVALNWLSSSLLGGVVSQGDFYTPATGLSMAFNHMSLKVISFSVFANAMLYQSDSRGDIRKIFIEKMIDTGILAHFYPHAFWGGMPRNVFSTNMGISAGLRLLDTQIYDTPVDRLMFMRWGVEVTRPFGSDKAFTGADAVSFFSAGLNVASPVTKYGQTGMIYFHLKISGNPLGRKKIIAPYFHKI